MVTPPKHPPSPLYQPPLGTSNITPKDVENIRVAEYRYDLGLLVDSTPDLKRLCEALDKDAGSQYHIANVGLGIVALLLRKNADYGDTAGRSPVLAPDLSAGEAILVRMSDKIARLSNLLQKKDGAVCFKAEVAESVEDTMRDLAGYAILWLVANNTEIDNAAKDNSGPALR